MLVLMMFSASSMFLEKGITEALSLSILSFSLCVWSLFNVDCGSPSRPVAGLIVSVLLTTESLLAWTVVSEGGMFGPDVSTSCSDTETLLLSVSLTVSPSPGTLAFSCNDCSTFFSSGNSNSCVSVLSSINLGLASASSKSTATSSSSKLILS